MSSVARVGRQWKAETGVTPEAWRTRIDALHTIAAGVIILALTALAIVSPRFRDMLDGWAGGALLIGGASIGLPHGSSDFVVAHRVLQPRLRGAWLPTFLVGYLALVAVVLAAWSAAPLATLIGFLALSAFHFGSGEINQTDGAMASALLFTVRATTPLLPVFLLHPTGVAPILAMLGGVAESSVIQVLGYLRGALLLPWIAVLSIVVIRDLTAARLPGSGLPCARHAFGLLTLAGAAVVLSPLLAFGLYFCLMHAARHLIGLAQEQHLQDGRAAAKLALAVILPSALVCFAALTMTWNGLAGMMDTQAMIAGSLKVIAALTVPHILLEAIAAHRSRPTAQSPWKL